DPGILRELDYVRLGRAIGENLDLEVGKFRHWNTFRDRVALAYVISPDGQSRAPLRRSRSFGAPGNLRPNALMQVIQQDFGEQLGSGNRACQTDAARNDETDHKRVDCP